MPCERLTEVNPNNCNKKGCPTWQPFFVVVARSSYQSDVALLNDVIPVVEVDGEIVHEHGIVHQLTLKGAIPSLREIL
jgi:hypothetical protein